MITAARNSGDRDAVRRQLDPYLLTAGEVGGETGVGVAEAPEVDDVCDPCS
jgi:hypothetical protein